MTHLDTKRPHDSLVRIPRLDEETIARYRKMQPHEKIAISFRLNEEVPDRIAMLLRQRFPKWSEQRVQDDVARRILHGLLDAGLAEENPMDEVIHRFSRFSQIK
jgi:hypothetical protein